ncbi:hypothetical protein ACFS07_22455 [Undibacterium arcticum]
MNPPFKNPSHSSRRAGTTNQLIEIPLTGYAPISALFFMASDLALSANNIHHRHTAPMLNQRKKMATSAPKANLKAAPKAAAKEDAPASPKSKKRSCS